MFDALGWLGYKFDWLRGEKGLLLIRNFISFFMIEIIAIQPLWISDEDTHEMSFEY